MYKEVNNNNARWFGVVLATIPSYNDAYYSLGLLLGLTHLNTEKTEDVKAEDIDAYKTNKFNHYVRLPILATGIAVTGRNIYNLIDSVLNGSSLNITPSEVVFGLGCLSSASLMYLKDRDPKLLERAPAWKRAYKWAKEKASVFAPQPLPQPIPVENKSKLI